jgi:hypothetical protein
MTKQSKDMDEFIRGMLGIKLHADSLNWEDGFFLIGFRNLLCTPWSKGRFL